MKLERTLIILKPDAVKRGLVGEIITRFERAGTKIVAMKMLQPDEKHFHAHYEGIGTMITRHGEEIYRKTLVQVADGPVIAFVLEGIEVISYARKLAGATDPKQAAPGTIRGDLTHMTREYANSNGLTMPNIIHASSDPGEAEREINLWFSQDELYSYEGSTDTVTLGKKVDLH